MRTRLTWILPFYFSHIGKNYYAGEGREPYGLHQPSKRKWTLHREIQEKEYVSRSESLRRTLWGAGSTKREFKARGTVTFFVVYCWILLGVCSAFIFICVFFFVPSLLLLCIHVTSVFDIFSIFCCQQSFGVLHSVHLLVE